MSSACFLLQYRHLRDLEYVEEENPHGARLIPQKMFRVRDVARIALQVNGPTGQNPQLRAQRATEEQERSATKQRMEAERQEAAAGLTPKTPSDEICQRAGVAPWNKLTKTDVLAKFDLESYELEALGVIFETKPNPRNPRFKPMRLYKAGDVAKALAGRKQRAQELTNQRRAAVAELLASKRASTAAAAIAAAGPQ
jgi:hypothetical protein